MRLQVGERLTGAGPASQPGGYVVTEVIHETPWTGWYAGKKIFYNFDFTNNRPRETDEKEWLEVFLRTLQYPYLDDKNDVLMRRQLAHAEASWLGRGGSNLWPEPLDLLEVDNTRDPFTFSWSDDTGGDSFDREPVLVLAKPHGQLLSEWRKQARPVSAMLSVLAELLHLVHHAHHEGLILNGFGPDSILIDRADRLHFIGTDMVIDSLQRDQQNVHKLDDEAGVKGIFPPERYPQGVAPPECFEVRRLPDQRSDLYAWTVMAFLLLTGDEPEATDDHRQRWVEFELIHFERLEQSLRSIPPAHVKSWALQLGVDPDALVSQWPESFVRMFQETVNPQSWRRPSSVAELRTWLTSPPSPPVEAVLALQTRPQLARIRWRFPNDADPDEYEVIVRRSAAVPPQHADAGELVAQGDGLITCDDRSITAGDAVYYGIFVRSHEAESNVYSQGHAAELLSVAPEGLRRYVEEDLHVSLVQNQETPRMQLLFETLDVSVAAKALYDSINPHLRWCAVHRLAEQPVLADDDPLLWRALQDSDRTVRLEAARGMLQGEPNFEKVADVVDRLGEDFDERIEWARALAEIGIPDSLIQRAIADLEGKRPTTCPACEVELADRDRTAHLREEHGWVDALGMLWPRDDALIRLWDRVLGHADLSAHEQLLDILAGNGSSSPTSGEENNHLAYIAALDAEIRRRSDTVGDNDAQTLVPDEYSNLLECIRRAPSLVSLPPNLLRSENERLRELGREIVLPDISRRLPQNASSEQLQEELDRLLRDRELLEEKIVICARLPSLGVDAAAVTACLKRLKGERPVRCTECHRLYRQCDIETHLRRGHSVFEYQGVRRTYDETRNFLLKGICGTSPDYGAWLTLETIVQERQGEKTPSRLASWVCQTLRSVTRERRMQTLGMVAEVAARSRWVEPMIVRLTEPFPIPHLERPAQALALEIIIRLTPPVSATLLQATKPLLGSRMLPLDLRQKATAALLRTTGDSGSEARQVLQAYLADSGKIRCVEKLQQLEPFAGQTDEIDAMLSELEDQVRMHCPRCGLELHRVQMVSHLWDEHRLVLEGRRVREPWRVIKDWLHDYRLEKDEAVLEYCRVLAQDLEGERGQARLNRLMLDQGIENADALQALAHRARRQGVCVCPYCFHRSPPIQSTPEVLLQIDDKTLHGRDCEITLLDGGLIPRAEVKTADGTVGRHRQPGIPLTRTAAMIAVVIPVILLGVIFALVFADSSMPLAAMLLIVFGAALLLTGAVFLFWPKPRPAPDRLIDLAWRHLAPQWIGLQLQPDSTAAVRDLAIISRGYGNPAMRHECLQAAQQLTEQHGFDDLQSAIASAAIRRLAIDDAAGPAFDPLPWMLEWASHCLAAQKPLAWLGEFLDGCDAPKRAPSWWTPSRRIRFEILLCDKAFAHGMEVEDLLELGKAFPRLGRMLRWDDANLLAHRRFVLSKLSLPPWDHFGDDVSTAFDLAYDEHSDSELLQHYPDLLLDIPSVPLLWCANGIVFENRRIMNMPESIDILQRNPYDDDGYDLVIGDELVWFRNKPDRIAERLEKALRYFFFDLQPQVSTVSQWRSLEITRRLRWRNALPCPSCGETYLQIAGEIGLKLEA